MTSRPPGIGQGCGNCLYWQPIEHRDPLRDGICRRHAPKPAVVEVDAGTDYGVSWPYVRADEWCGEYVAFTAGAR